MYCFQCGKQIDEDVKFCPHCGQEQKLNSGRAQERKSDETGKELSDLAGKAGEGIRAFLRKLSSIRFPGKRGLLAVIAVIAVVMLISSFGGKADSRNGSGSSENSGSDRKNTSIFSKNEVCITCDGNKNCIACNGEGYCAYCSGTGKINCLMCWGTDLCGICLGTKYDEDGDRCSICGGKGTCTWDDCEEGYEDCSFCYGRKPCNLCNGENVCPTCDGKGSYSTDTPRRLTAYKKVEHNCLYGKEICDQCDDGVCKDCEGRKKEECYGCDGTGKCSSCDDNPNRNCPICDNTRVCTYSGCVNGYENCIFCEGTGMCQKCRGTHERECSYCVSGFYFEEYSYSVGNASANAKTVDGREDHGSDVLDIDSFFEDECSNCFGEGELPCTCTLGQCVECAGEGHTLTYASGKIKEVDCAYCVGGVCRKCGGSNYEDCPYC